MKATTRRRQKLDLSVKNVKGDLITITLEDGRVVKLRPMLGKDLLFLERELKEMGDTERSLRLLDRLSVEPNNITFVELLELEAHDIETLSIGLAKANGVVLDEMEDEEEEE
ncbi:MAG: hypothetical protein R3321_04750 [Nitrososphaeraceae archaeon]|nr:hypothetical protein [Nitrososphaeraceae archaeon]